MIRSLRLLAISLLVFHTSHGQRSQPTKKKFPFNTSTTILLISFTAPPLPEPVIIGDTTPPKAVIKFGKYGDTLGHSDVREIVKLSSSGIKKLSDAINKTTCNGLIEMRGCYDPRNAVIFIDESGSIVAELEICFECYGYTTKPKGLYVNDDRDCMFDAWKKIFADEGIKYGVATRRN